jgi:FkbM family methyltransferase
MDAIAMNKSNGHPRLPLLGKLLRLYLRSRARGSTRLTFLLARKFKSLQRLPLEIPGWASVYVDLRIPNAHHMLIESPYEGLWRELDEVAIMSRFVRPGDVVFDIGANIGLHSIVLSRLVGSGGRVFAFEPNSELSPALSYTLRQLENATLHKVALSNKSAESSLFVPPDDSMASLADWTTASLKFSQDGPSHVVTCIERRMDDLMEDGTVPKPDFIKCDVEGAEAQVFGGGWKTLNRVDAPLILFEVNECASQAFNYDLWAARDFLAGLTEARYHFFQVNAGGNLEALGNVDTKFTNILAIPESKMTSLSEVPGFVHTFPHGDRLQALQESALWTAD